MVRHREFMARGISRVVTISSYKKKMPKPVAGVGGYRLREKLAKSF